MEMIKSRSIIPHFPTDHGLLPTDHHSGVTGIDIMRKTTFWVTFAEFKMFVVRTKVLRFLY